RILFPSIYKKRTAAYHFSKKGTTTIFYFFFFILNRNYCKRLNFREDLIFANRLRFSKNRSREQFGQSVNTTEATFDSRKLEPANNVFQLWPDLRKFGPAKIKSFIVLKNCYTTFQIIILNVFFTPFVFLF
ncbi:MAG: hypothetical protein PV344_05415, partial [Anaplasma sp.]|nr:hypothetical protein [Anaplasma sp.]